MRIELVEYLICCLTSVAASTEFEERKGGDWGNALSENRIPALPGPTGATVPVHSGFISSVPHLPGV